MTIKISYLVQALSVATMIAAIVRRIQARGLYTDVWVPLEIRGHERVPMNGSIMEIKAKRPWSLALEGDAHDIGPERQHSSRIEIDPIHPTRARRVLDYHNEHEVSCQDLTFINKDEILVTPDDLVSYPQHILRRAKGFLKLSC
jgi:hypothetical protein